MQIFPPTTKAGKRKYRAGVLLKQKRLRKERLRKKAMANPLGLPMWVFVGGLLGVGAVGAGVYYAWKKRSSGQPVAFLPSKATPKPVSLTAPVLLHEGDNGAFLLQPTRDFLWVKIPDEIVKTPGIGDVEMFTGDFQPRVEKRQAGQVYLMVPPGADSGSRGATTLSLGVKDKIIWQAILTLVAA